MILRASPVLEIVKVAQTTVRRTPWLVSVEEVIHLGPRAFCKINVKVVARQKYMREEPLIAISARELVRVRSPDPRKTMFGKYASKRSVRSPAVVEPVGYIPLHRRERPNARVEDCFIWFEKHECGVDRTVNIAAQ